METALVWRDFTTARETLFAKGAAHDENVLILVHDPAEDHLAILEGEQGHAIAFLDLLARSEEKLYEVVGGRLGEKICDQASTGYGIKIIESSGSGDASR
jgi:hypothetical protein|tara:strand:+ start:468 stop:767 length:300 start_codon:yes stop_codon:yes gene_type:complete